MGFLNGERPLNPRRGRTASRAAKAKEAARVKDADRRALAHYNIFLFADSLPGYSVRELVDEIAARLHDPRPPALLQGVGPIGRSTLHRILVKGREARARGDLSVETFARGAGSGRPRTKLDPRLLEHLLDLIRIRPGARLTYYLSDLEEIAAEFGLPRPTLHMVESVYRSIDPAELAVARHGAKAGMADAMQRATIPTSRPHEVWTLDELQIPVWIKAYDPARRRLVSVQPFAVVIVDNHSRVVVAFHVVPPFGSGATVGYSSADILGAFYSAALPDLAPPSLRRFSGFLCDTLRMDNHATHTGLREILEANGVNVPDLPVQTPYSRGLIERLVGSVKGICEDIRGHEASWLPADQVEENPSRTRSAAAATLDRVARKTIIAVEDLYDVDELTAQLLTRLEKYHERPHRILRRAPVAVYLERLRREESRPGIDALRWLPVVRLQVGRGRIEHRNRVFAARVAGRTLRHGAQVTCRAEPLGRGLYLMQRGVPWFLRPLDEEARYIDPGRFAEDQREAAAAISQSAEDAHRRRLETQAGEDAALRAEVEMRVSIAEAKQRKRERKRRSEKRIRDRQRQSREVTRPQAVPDAPAGQASRRRRKATPVAAEPELPPPPRRRTAGAAAQADADEFPVGVRRSFKVG